MISPKIPQLLYGADYHPEQWPESVWLADMELMRRAGVNFVTVGIFAWARLQPAHGAWNFDWLDRALDLLHQNGIFAGLATGTAAPPPWLAKMQPDSLPVNAHGQRGAAGARQLYCPNSRAYREAAARVVRQLATRYGRHPALAAWHINHEFGVHLTSCHCDQCAAQFRLWLQQKYRTLEMLNEHWGTAVGSQWYSQWDEILPPGPLPPAGNPGQELDYRRFTSDSLLACLANEKSVLREITPDIPVTTNFTGPHGFSKVVNGFDWAPYVDFISFDSCPDPLQADPADLAFACDLQRGLGGGKSWLLLERAPCPGSSAAKRPGQVRLWSHQALAHGANGTLLFQWRAPRTGPEKFFSAMVPHGGPGADSFQELEQLGGELKKLASICGARASAEVALVVDWENMWALDLAMPGERFDYPEIVRSYYRALFEPDIAIDIVLPHADLAPYKLVIAPALHLVRGGVPENFERFVDNGGTLVLSFFSGIVDDSNRVLTGGYPAPFRKLLGIRIEEFDPFAPGQMKHIKTSLRGAKCSLWADVITLEGAEACATFTEDYYAHRPAITLNAVGRGLAYYIGTHPEPGFLRTFLSELCTDSGVRPPMRVPNGIEVTTRSNEHGEFLFLLNHNTTMQFVELGPRTRRDLLTGEMIHGQCQIGPRDVRVLQLA